jgi:hypothetical protein
VLGGAARRMVRVGRRFAGEGRPCGSTSGAAAAGAVERRPVRASVFSTPILALWSVVWVHREPVLAEDSIGGAGAATGPRPATAKAAELAGAYLGGISVSDACESGLIAAREVST